MICIQSFVPLIIYIISKHVINSIISSPALKFLARVDKRLFTVHTGLVALILKSLAVLINRSMSKAQGGCAWLEDVDEHAFVRFSQYAYIYGGQLPGRSRYFTQLREHCGDILHFGQPLCTVRIIPNLLQLPKGLFLLELSLAKSIFNLRILSLAFHSRASRRQRKIRKNAKRNFRHTIIGMN